VRKCQLWCAHYVFQWKRCSTHQADRLLELGFKEEVNEIIRNCPKGRQTMLFSATMTDEVGARWNESGYCIRVELHVSIVKQRTPVRPALAIFCFVLFFVKRGDSQRTCIHDVQVDDLIALSLHEPVRLFVHKNTETASNLVQEFVRIRQTRETDRDAFLLGVCVCGGAEGTRPSSQ
jgi:hypothetical protein